MNNVQYVRYAETGRCNWTRNFGTYWDVAHKQQWEEMLSSRNVGLILRSIKVDFKFVSGPVSNSEPVTPPILHTGLHKQRKKSP